jgi:hypothetical protein
VADDTGDLFSVEDETGNIKQITSPETKYCLGNIVMDTSETFILRIENPTVFTNYPVILNSTKLLQILNSMTLLQSALTKTALNYSLQTTEGSRS